MRDRARGWFDFFPMDGPHLSACSECGIVVLSSMRDRHVCPPVEPAVSGATEGERR